MKSLRLKKLIITRAVELMVVAALAGGVILVANLVQGARVRLMERQTKLEASLNEAVHRAVVADKLALHQVEIKRVIDMVPWRDEVGQVVETVDNEARRWGVTVLVPKISEEKQYDENGTVIEQAGPTRLIRLTVEASGDPLALVNLLHSLENLPYLMTPVSFVLDNEASQVGAVGAIALAPSGPVPEEATPTVPVKMAILKADFLLTVRVEESRKYEQN